MGKALGQLLDADGKPICGIIKKDGKPCRGHAMPNGRCYKHGGATPAGLASPNFKHGKYSSVVPGRMLARYQEAEQDPALLSLRSELALLDGRLFDLLGRVDTGESGRIWGKAQEAVLDLRAANLNKDQEAAGEALNRLIGIISKGHSDYAAWHEVHEVVDQRRRIAESERKRLVETHQMITTERALALMGAIVGAIKEEINDQKLLQRISARILGLAQGGGIPL